MIAFGSSGRGSSGGTIGCSDFVEFLGAGGGTMDTGNDRAISSGGSYEVQPYYPCVSARAGYARDNLPISSLADVAPLSVEFLGVDTQLVSPSPMTVLSALPLSRSHKPR